MQDLKLVTENILGETKGTELERVVKQNFNGETSEVGMYLAMARLAQRQGYPEIAEVLKTIAWEEAEHAAVFAELNGMLQEDIFENIKRMLEGEVFANQGKKEAADKAQELGIASARDYFNLSAKDEARHARMLQGILKRYNKI
ncbi:rubrerythrin family protein [Caldicoprobacter algeriensis]|uniref:Rubrerythrin n=1 Tax=Caldicoprobacter faecalis TaxID=937334 RepID=A0A1I5V7F7_9FIRM|nr:MULTISPECIES: ferritin family protein [Caldicoprobacter]MCM8900456.1 rubrerythrin family protein [Caldicoprobacter algeriensis]PZN11249.1 MAG: rubrerythrin family protein [Caldicoprobacter oshimai]SFQ03361.1 Rubrerythrin [Caldicoprobacter faecalis]